MAKNCPWTHTHKIHTYEIDLCAIDYNIVEKGLPAAGPLSGTALLSREATRASFSALESGRRRGNTDDPGFGGREGGR